MKVTRFIVVIAVFLISLGAVFNVCQAEDLKIAIMQAQMGEAKKFQPLINYLGKKGIDVSLVGTPNYPAAAKMFSAGEADAMFSGSGVAGAMIIKDVAYPLVRPVNKQGYSTYWAVVIAPKGSPKFTQNAEYFRNKAVIFSSLASSGEFYFRSIPGSITVGAGMKQAASHGAAIDALSKGAADIAIVKNRVWDSVKSKYPNLEKVGEDTGENPDGTLIISKSISSGTAEKVKSALIALKDDQSPEAKAVRDSLKAQEYIATTADDFKHTIGLLKKAGVTKAFNFEY